MFVEFYSALIIKLDPCSSNDQSLINIEPQINNNQPKPINHGQIWRRIRVIFIWQGSKTSKSPRVKKLRGIFSGSLFLLLINCRHPIAAIAQTPNLITPDPPQTPSPQPLPQTEPPLDDSLTTPPTPESVWDIPGKIVVEKFTFQGNTVFSEAELNSAIAQFRGKPISFAQLVQAANTITKLYVSKGYITSGAYIPEQNLTSEGIQIQVVEGSLAEIVVNVTKGRLKENYIRDRLDSKITTPLNINQLQSALQLLQLNPLIDNLNAELSAGVQPGTNSLRVSVTGADSFIVKTKLNNNRNSSIGTFERAIGVRENNLLGIGDSIHFNYNNTDGSHQYTGGYTFPLNPQDGSISFDFQITNNQIIEPPLDKADIDINSYDYDLTWRQPVFKRATSEVSQELALNLTASKRESKTTILDTPESLSPGTDNRGIINTSVLSFGQEWLQRNRTQVIAARSQFNLGLDVLGASSSDSEPNGQFFTWRGQFSYLRLLTKPKGNPAIGSTILWRSELQLAGEALIPTEQFSLGGATSVRGYRQDALLTDNGFSATTEFRFPIARIPKINGTVEFSPFIDFGTGWNSDGEATEFNTLLSTGFGFLLQTEDNLSARIDWGIPLINNNSQGRSWQDNGVYVQLEYNFF
ncbi:surface antigen D15 domain-containing protein [Chondrocystis sp. NIES-4102]|nr:surface antigen D15 domain-containing protein [Chondrocystis sp. NIES-4102]